MQLYMICPTTISSTDATAAATTGGPFKLPPWAPDIDWVTTSTNNEWPLMTASSSPILSCATSNAMLRKRDSIASYTKRTFGLKPQLAAASGNITVALSITYRAVGELTRA